jgi:hypothetical protein
LYSFHIQFLVFIFLPPHFYTRESAIEPLYNYRAKLNSVAQPVFLFLVNIKYV